MKILYGVVGEGMGHATRSRVIIEELVKEHEVHIVVSGRAQQYLAQRFENVHGIWGLTIHYEDNSVKKLQTVLQNLKGSITGWPRNIKKYFELVNDFAPDVVVSDFESFSYMYGKNHFLPIISVDNMQVIHRCRHDPELLEGHKDAFRLTKAMVKAKLPGAFHYLVTSFFYPPLRKERTTLKPSILRPEILAAQSEPGEHLLVYQTSSSHSALPELLKQSRIPCRIYGVKRELTEDLVDDNLTYRPFSEKAFIEDLRTARAVVAGGGYTLMSEAIYLHKPMLSVPVGGQFEQVLNALYLDQLGYGSHAPELSPEALKAFLERLPRCEDALAPYTQNGNVEMFAALKEQLSLARKHQDVSLTHTRP